MGYEPYLYLIYGSHQYHSYTEKYNLLDNDIVKKYVNDDTIVIDYYKNITDNKLGNPTKIHYVFQLNENIYLYIKSINYDEVMYKSYLYTPIKEEECHYIKADFDTIAAAKNTYETDELTKDKKGKVHVLHEKYYPGPHLIPYRMNETYKEFKF